VIHLTGSLDLRSSIQNFFQTQPNKSAQDFKKKEKVVKEKKPSRYENDSDEDVNLKDLMKKDTDWIGK
jgi:hypothetical protein